jgi:cell wall-associated NlpC family hydrolase
VWNQSEWAPFVSVEMQEAGWDPHAQNPTSSAYGLAQNINPSTYPAAGRPGSKAPLLEQAKAQLEWMVSYIKGRYGTPSGAWAHEQSAGWYAKGGLVDLGGWLVPPDRKGSKEEIDRLRKLGVKGFAKGGTASSGSSAKPKGPSVLERIVGRMKQLAAMHVPYVWGGGHGGFSAHPSGLDCSGAVSDALHAGGVLDTPEDSTALESFGKPGPGKVEIFANAGHTFMNALGRFWGTSVDDNGAGGLGFHPAPPKGYLSSFVLRHVPEGLLGSASGISGSAFKPSMPAQVKGRYAKHKAGGTSAGGGTYAETEIGHYKVQTGKLSFNAPAGTVEGCRRELRELRRMLGEYEAAGRKTKDPATKRALNANAKLIRKQIREVVKAMAKLLKERAQAEKVKKIEGRGTFPEVEKAIEASEGRFNELSERAERVIALEPESGPSAISYIEEQEGPAWAAVLGSENAWRNNLLGGEEAASSRLVSLRAQLQHIEDLRDHSHGSSPKAKAARRAFRKERFKIPALNKAIGEVESASKSFEESLGSLQGLGKPHGRLASLPSVPSADGFGGTIFGTQMSISELGLKIKQAQEAGQPESNTALLEAKLALAENANRDLRLKELQYGPLAAFLKAAPPPYLGAFEKGGVLPADGFYLGHKDETVIPAGQGGAAPAVILEQHFHGELANLLDVITPGLAKEVDRQMGAKYRHIRFGPTGRKR